MKIALCQMNVINDKKSNIQKASEMIGKAKEKGADIVALPEMFNCPYSNSFFKTYSETEGGETEEALSKIAKENQVYVIGGSIPERDGDKIYNTCYAFDRKGEKIGKHRKIHLFDINVEGGVCFKESDTLTAGDQITVIETEFGKVGIAICYDVRFPELFRLMALRGASLIVLPGAFNMTTGPAHWDLTMRARALDNQVYFAAVSPARDMNFSYHAYGHSCLVNPWGEVQQRLSENEEILIGDVDLSYVEKVRRELPLLAHRRTDVYEMRVINER